MHGLMGRGKTTTIAKGLQKPRPMLVDLPNHGASCWMMISTTSKSPRSDRRRTPSRFCKTNQPSSDTRWWQGRHAAGVASSRADRRADYRGHLSTDHPPVNSNTYWAPCKLDLSQVLTPRCTCQAETDINNTAVRGLITKLDRDEHHGYLAAQSADALRCLPTIVDFPLDQRYDHPVLWIKVLARIHQRRVHRGHAKYSQHPKIQIRNTGHWVHSEQTQPFLQTIDYYIAGRYS